MNLKTLFICITSRDKKITCIECGNAFMYDKQKVIASRMSGMPFPDNCKTCRNRKKRNAYAAKLRRRAHDIFDKLWQKGDLTRNEAYRWAAEKLKNKTGAHIHSMRSSDIVRLIKIIEKDFPEFKQ